ncbi:MAG: hypothetical protein BWZ10_01875 [candidate division BRC1 bacterium ADurb.BinA364]|nr:MAG: hypothetical protein BWZ10_01875 [candidate division BRC1 bacterium ADurb.BinA364]
MIEARIWGDEFYQTVESLDGYTLVRDPQSGYICYAEMDSTGERLVSTGVRAGEPQDRRPQLPKGLRESRETVRAAVAKARESFAALDGAPDEARRGLAPASAVEGAIEGLCLIVDFPDFPGTIPPSSVDAFCNQIGYNQDGRNGSVRDYFHDVSNGRLTYTNYVPPAYYTAIHNKSYYDDNSLSAGIRGRELVLEALNALEAGGFDFSLYDKNGDGRIDAINCLYAGQTTSAWAKGLWPHSGILSAFSADGVSSYRYQITDMRTALPLATFCHENGHMICGWPDLYDYDYDSRGVGQFCLMCNYGSQSNPLRPSGPLRYLAGWTQTIELAAPAAGLSLTAASDKLYRLADPAAGLEAFFVEIRHRSGRDSSLPDSGLAVWLYDPYGDNDLQDRLRTSHYMVSLMQADGFYQLERNINYGDANDLFAGPGSQCGPLSEPKMQWWSGEPSDLVLTNISPVGTTMTFDFGVGFTLDPGGPFKGTGPAGGPFRGTAGEYELANPGAAPVRFAIEADANWVSASPDRGTLGPGESAQVQLLWTANALALAPGAHAAAVRFANADTSHSLARAARLAVEDFASLPFSESFEEAGGFRPCWRFSGTNEWRMEKTTAYSPRGQRHLAFDDWSLQGGYSRNEATLGLDLANWRHVQLSFWARSFGGDSPHGPPPAPFVEGADFDGVAVSADGVNWYEIQSLRQLSAVYTRIEIDLDAAVQALGLAYSDRFRIRFNQYDNYPLSFHDGYVLDDIKVIGEENVSSVGDWPAYRADFADSRH